MGTFAGHALPGSFFIFFGLWAVYHAMKQFYKGRSTRFSQTSQSPYMNRISFPLTTKETGCFRGKSIPLDSYLKAFTCIVGIAGEVFTGFDSEWKFVHIGNAQHCTMFATFGLSGFVELAMFYGLLKVPLQVEYVFGVIALLAEGFLFFFHLHGRTPVDIYVHMLLAGMIILSLLTGIFEVVYSQQPTWLLIRNLGILVQGTWFWQVGAILYPVTSWMPRWDELAKQSVPRAANVFCYHILIDFTAILLIAVAMSIIYGHSRAERIGSGRAPGTQFPSENHVIDTHMIDPSEEHEMWRAPVELEAVTE